MYLEYPVAKCKAVVHITMMALHVRITATYLVLAMLPASVVFLRICFSDEAYIVLCKHLEEEPCAQVGAT